MTAKSLFRILLHRRLHSASSGVWDRCGRAGRRFRAALVRATKVEGRTTGGVVGGWQEWMGGWDEVRRGEVGDG